MNAINDIIEAEYPHIEGDKPLSQALSLLKDHDGIIILNNGNYDGVLQKRDLSKAKISLETKIKTLLKHVAKLSSDETLETTAGLMLESDSYVLPIFQKDRLVGMISAENLLRKAAKNDFGDESIDRFMTTTVRTIHPDEPVSKAMKIFDEEDISRLPVLKNDRIIGIITIDDILTKITHPEHRQGGSGQYEDSSKFGTYMADKSEYLDLPVHGIMSETVDIMSSDENVRSIVESMFQKNYRGIIIGKQDELEGVVTKRDLLVPLASFTVLEPMIIQFSGELDRIKDFEKTRAREIIQTNFEKYLEYLDNAHIVVRLKQHDEQSKGRHIIYCKMRLSSPRGMFIGTDEGWGYLDAINKSSEAIDRQIRKQKTR